MELNITATIMLALFLLIFVWLTQMLFKPFLRIYDERERRIDGAAEEARSLKEGAQAQQGEVERRLAEASEQARDILDGLRDEGAAKERALIDAARAKSQGLIEDAKADLFAASADARKQLKTESERIADDIVASVLGRAA